MIVFSFMFKKIVVNGKADVVKWLIIWKVPLFSLNSISSKTLVCLQWGKLTLINNLYFQISYQIILINLDVFPKNNNGYFVACFHEVYGLNLV